MENDKLHLAALEIMTKAYLDMKYEMESQKSIKEMYRKKYEDLQAEIEEMNQLPRISLEDID